VTDTSGRRPSGRQRLWIGLLLGVVIVGGIASLVMRSGPQEEEEEIVIVDLSPPPPPPPPPPPEEEPPPEPEDAIDEAQELAEADAPEEMSEDTNDAVDLGLDPGDLDVGTGGSFVMEIPKFGIGGRGGGNPFSSGELDTPPQAVSKAQPIYPSRLLSKGIGGRVVVEVVVDPTGKIAGAKVRTGSGSRDLDEAALKAVKKWRFRPAVKDGKKTRAKVLIPFDFEVKR